MPKDAVQTPQNRLLASLSPANYALLSGALEPVALPYRTSLYRARAPIKHITFLESGVASLVNTMKNGSASEVGTIGNEGLVGLPVLLGDDRAPTSVYMQVAGAGLRITSKHFCDVLLQSVSIRTAMLHYAHAFFNQVSQSAACATFHGLEQRCCRWILMTHDRMQCDDFTLTQEFLAMMLGVRRAGVTVAAGALKRAGLLRYTRGKVTILDRRGLELRACECYSVTTKEFDRLLGPAAAMAGIQGTHKGRAYGAWGGGRCRSTLS